MRPDLSVAVPLASELGWVHFVGIGGAGMSAIARIMLARGIPVSGSDANDGPVLAELAALGAHVHVGHDAANVGAADTVVVSSAIREPNPEHAQAKRSGLRVLHRSLALASVMAGHRVAAIAGTHGKTTTTSMLTVALRACGADPSYAIGGDLAATGLNGYDGTGDIFVAEADESDGSFLAYSPAAAIVTNVEPDHLDFYGTASAVAESFAAFVRRVVPGGFAVVCGDDSGAAALAAHARAAGLDVRTYGERDHNDVRVVGVRTLDAIGQSFTVARHGQFTLRVPGRHNVLNATAALTVGLGLGFPADRLRTGLAEFTGARRRFELVGEAAGVRVYDDYAHHPTEVAATLRTAREVANRGQTAGADHGRVIAVFQPHLFSRTRLFAAEFGAALALADHVVVMDVYAAREDPEPGVTGELIARAVPLPAQSVRFETVRSAVAPRAAGLAQPGDAILTIGAGDVTALGPEILKRLAGRE